MRISQRPMVYFFMMLISSIFYTREVNANIVIYPIEVNVGGKGSSEIQVISRSDEVSFVRVTIKKIINPGTPQEKEISANMIDQNSLVVTPQKLAISPGGKRIVRLVALNSPEFESTWRVYFEEVSGKDFNSITLNGQSNKKAAQVGVSIIWGALVHVAPLSPLTSLKIDGNTGNLINDGTVRLPLTEIGECNISNLCTWKKQGATIYPGTSVKVKSFSYHPGNTYKVRFKDWLSGNNKEISLPVVTGSE